MRSYKTGPRHARRRHRDPRTFPAVILVLEVIGIIVLLVVAP